MDLNLYLGTGNLTSDLRMDLGSNLSLGPLPADPGDPHGPATPTGLANSDPAETDDIFRGITPSSPSQGLSPSATLRVFGHTFVPYNGLAQSPANPFSPIFGDDPVARGEYLDILGDPLAPVQPAMGDGEAHALFLPSFEPLVAPLEARDSSPAATQQPAPPEPTSSAFPRNELPSSVENLLRSPQLRFRTLIEYETRRERSRRRRALVDHGMPAPSASSFFSPARPVCDATSNRPPEVTGNGKLNGDDVCMESTGNVIEDKSRTINFECNICLDIAKEPVVTSCGHLFCWPCLYQWLHLHSVHKECPVCKGEVDMNITPIYGRGSSETDAEEGTVVGGETGLKIPPRPRGRRFESLRQQLQRPISRRLIDGIADPWRRSAGGDWRSLARMDDPTWRLSRPSSGNPIQNERLDTIHHRLRARRQIRLAESLNFSANAAIMDLPTTLIIDPQVQNTISVSQGAANHFHGGHGTVSAERQSTMHNESAVDSSSVDARISAPSVSLTQPENHDAPVGGNTQSVFVSQPAVTSHSADQASASSTLALIQDDRGATDALVEPNSVGSSGLLRRRRWTEASGSLDFDGGFPPARKRRRLN